jgi:hypothetical protein
MRATPRLLQDLERGRRFRLIYNKKNASCSIGTRRCGKKIPRKQVLQGQHEDQQMRTETARCAYENGSHETYAKFIGENQLP